MEFNQYQKSNKTPFIISADIECLIEEIDWRENNSEDSCTTKDGKHISSGFSMSTISSFRSIKNKHDVYRGKNWMKTFLESSTEHTMVITDLL